MKKCRLCKKVHPFDRRQALRLQAATPGKLRRLLAGFSAQQLRRRPQARKWSMVEIAAHLLDVEVAFGFRYRKILAEPGSRLLPFDQERWASRLHYRRQDPRVVLDAFAALRRHHLGLLAGLSSQQWQQWGKHPDYPRFRYRLEPVFVHLAAHDLNHLGQVQALRRRWLTR